MQLTEGKDQRSCRTTSSSTYVVMAWTGKNYLYLLLFNLTSLDLSTLHFEDTICLCLQASFFQNNCHHTMIICIVIKPGLRRSNKHNRSWNILYLVI